MRILAGAAGLMIALMLAGAPTAAESTDPFRTLEAVRAAVPPVRDQAELRGRIARAADTAPPAQPIEPGAFWITDLTRHRYLSVPADLVHVSEHADWYVERGRAAADIVTAASFFESRTFPRIRELTGVEWTPGSNGQARLAIFNGTTPGVAGYMSAGDTQPRSVFPYSNERLIVYLSLDSLRPGTSGYDATLAHELEHLAHYVVNPAQEGWLDEGLAELAANVVMEQAPPRLATFRGQPDVQLNAWSEKPWEARAHYEASSLWARYLMERGGGPAALAGLVRSGGQGLTTVERYAQSLGAGGAESLFRDWLIANVLDQPAYLDGRYGYWSLDQRSSFAASLQIGDSPIEASVQQFAADYYQLPLDGPFELQVEVAPTVPLLAAGARGEVFWGLRGDNIDTRMTRDFDLRGLATATLRYRVWHDLEPDFDYCYVLGTADGAIWTPLRGRWTADADALGLAFGSGYSGRSAGGPSWVDEEVDLSAFAGQLAQVRFECITDQNYSATGFAVDDLEVPELGFADDGETDQGWQAEGFVRVADQMAQPAAVMVVEATEAGVSVHDMALDPAGRGRLAVGAGGAVRSSTLVVAGLAPRTLQPMSYRLWLSPAAL